MDNSRYYANYGYGNTGVGNYNDLWKNYTIDVTEQIKLYQMLQNGRKPKSYFDIGCANGKLLEWALQLGIPDVAGIDIDPQFCKSNKVPIEICSILDYNKPLNYDLVYINNVLTYFSEQELDVIIPKLKDAKVVILFQISFENGLGQGGDPFDAPKLVRPILWWCDKFASHGMMPMFSKAFSAYMLVASDVPYVAQIDWARFEFDRYEIRHKNTRLFFDENRRMTLEGAPDKHMRALVKTILDNGYSIKSH